MGHQRTHAQRPATRNCSATKCNRSQPSYASRTEYKRTGTCTCAVCDEVEGQLVLGGCVCVWLGGGVAMDMGGYTGGGGEEELCVKCEWPASVDVGDSSVDVGDCCQSNRTAIKQRRSRVSIQYVSKQRRGR